MNTQRFQFVAVAVVAMGWISSTSALADWEAGDPHKMHFPQLPDPNGLDINFESPYTLADDWQCSETGPVSDIHFWLSHKGDNPNAPILFGLRVEIYSNIPALPTGGFSRPGELLWSAGGPLPFDEFDFATATGGTGDQGWYDPFTGEYIPHDHDSYFQINLTNIKEPFVQEEGEIYWLAVSIDTSQSDGWKTADLDKYPAPYTGSHFEDDAVFRNLSDGSWRELHYPSGHPRAGQSIDLAFVITPEPTSASLLILAGLMLLGRRQRRHSAT